MYLCVKRQKRPLLSTEIILLAYYYMNRPMSGSLLKIIFQFNSLDKSILLKLILPFLVDCHTREKTLLREQLGLNHP